jgi:hypothetical protein
LALSPHYRHRPVERQKWISVLSEHIDYSTIMLSAKVEDDDDNDNEQEVSMDSDFARRRSLGCLKDALQTADANKELLIQDVESLTETFHQLPPSYRQGALYSLLLVSFK